MTPLRSTTAVVEVLSSASQMRLLEVRLMVMPRVLLQRCVSVVLFVLVATASAWAQTAEVSGRVTDESGAVLPGVTVTVTQTDTGFIRSVVTDGSGSYVMPNLPTGPYRLEVALQGFRTYVQTGIVLQVASPPVINRALALGDHAIRR
jgi:hypothetical protein